MLPTVGGPATDITTIGDRLTTILGAGFRCADPEQAGGGSTGLATGDGGGVAITCGGDLVVMPARRTTVSGGTAEEVDGYRRGP